MVGFTQPSQDYPLILKWAGYPKTGDFIGVVGNWRSRRFGRVILKGFGRNGRLPVESHFTPLNGWLMTATRLSDHASFWDAGWPAVDEAALEQASIEYVVQVNGKVRGKVQVPADADRVTVEAAARSNENVQRFIGDARVRKVIVVPGKLVNIVAK